MRRTPSVRLSLLIACLFMAGSAFGQCVELRHQFTPGSAARAMTTVTMNGDSILTGETVKTNMDIRMLRGLETASVDSLGAADLTVRMLRMTVKGAMGDAKFNEDLKDDKLKQTMFNQSEMKMRVTPQGEVQGSDTMGLEKAGIPLPAAMGEASGGGFEFPTFPMEAVKAGDSWNESGHLLTREELTASPDQRVYRLERLYKSAGGVHAVIRYRKTTEFKGLELGGAGLGAGAGAGLGTGAGVGTPTTQLKGLTIQLEGLIEFDVTHGKVIKSDQQGLWKLDMTSPVEGRKPVSSQHGMKIRIQTQFDWNQTPQSALNP
ncbi:MAG: hypothetical protein GC154_14490 [bacterium]|nr:hypothetical protein [bacterium]